MLSTTAISLVWSVLSIFNILDPTHDSNPIVTLPTGRIRGRTAYTTTNRPYYAFQKIPFAAPPIGDLRFQPPQPPSSWPDILDTQHNDVICYQMPSDSGQETEDCLYLNVYTPQLGTKREKLAVLFYIYGGGFIEGNCLEENAGPDFLIDRDVIVVATNYRVGPFGFLSTEDLVIPGNNGLKDQYAALQWTYDNIHLFGGDPQKITLLGQSAGAASVSYQLLHLKSRGLFRAAICESGSFLCPWAFQRRARQMAFKTAAYLNSTFETSNDSRQLLEFLKSVPAEDLDAASYQLSLTETPQTRQINQGFFFAPVVEPEHPGAFLTRKMYGKLRDGDFAQVPTLIGINSEENVYHAYAAAWLKGTMDVYDNNLSWLVPDDMRIDESENRTAMGRKIREIYTNGEALSQHPAPAVRFYSDNSYTRPIIRHAEMQAQFTDVYFYQFSYDGKMGNFSFTIEGAENITHGEELKYIWRMQGPYYDNSDLGQFPLRDRIVQHRILKMWTDFAKTLNPTPVRTLLNHFIKWPKVAPGQNGNFEYVDILENLYLKRGPKNATYPKWKALYDSLDYDNFDTY